MSKISDLIQALTPESTVEGITAQLVEASTEFDAAADTIDTLNNQITELNENISSLKAQNYELMKQIFAKGEPKGEPDKNVKPENVSDDDIFDAM